MVFNSTPLIWFNFSTCTACRYRFTENNNKGALLFTPELFRSLAVTRGGFNTLQRQSTHSCHALSRFVTPPALPPVTSRHITGKLRHRRHQIGSLAVLQRRPSTTSDPNNPPLPPNPHPHPHPHPSPHSPPYSAPPAKEYTD